jgi:hypothetical protein
VTLFENKRFREKMQEWYYLQYPSLPLRSSLSGQSFLERDSGKAQ